MPCMCVLLIFLLVSVSAAQRTPSNNCPNYFNYKYENGIYFGQLEIPYDGSHTLDLHVNTSFVGVWRNWHIKLKLITPMDLILRSHPVVEYKVDFPSQKVLPKITAIRFNGRLLCSGPSETLDREGVTNLWTGITHHFDTCAGCGHQAAEMATANNNNNNNHNPVNGNNVLHVSPPIVVLPDEIRNKEPLDESVVECGISNNFQKLIVNGERTNDNEYPWLVALFRRQGVNYEFICTGSLISTNYVLTAAHCVQFYNAPLFPVQDILLILGRSNLTHWAVNGATIRSAKFVKAHQNYRQYSGHCDVALVEMNEPVTYTATIRPICLWQHHVPQLDTGMVVGWGADDSGRQNVPALLRVEMPIVSQETCLRSNPSFLNLTSVMTFCAGNRKGAGPCTGDSGAPLMVKKDGKWFLRGLVSIAIRDNNNIKCNLNEYVVFADMAKLVNWIKTYLNNQ